MQTLSVIEYKISSRSNYESDDGMDYRGVIKMLHAELVLLQENDRLTTLICRLGFRIIWRGRTALLGVCYYKILALLRPCWIAESFMDKILSIWKERLNGKGDAITHGVKIAFQ